MRAIPGEWMVKLAEEEPNVYPAFIVDLRDAAGATTTHVFVGSGGQFPDGSDAYKIHARLLSVGSFRIGFDPLSPSIMLADSEATIADPDGYVWQLIEAAPNRKAECRISWVCPDIDEDLPRYTGIVHTWTPSPTAITVTVKPDDRKLDNAVPSVPISKSDWPSLTGATAANYGAFAPIVFGEHSSTGLLGTGMVPCVPVAWTTGSVGWYAVAAHLCESIDDVFVDGVAKTVTTHYTTEVIYGLRSWHVIKFTAGNIPTDTAVVTANVKGVELAGFEHLVYGTGPLTTNPVYQLRKFLIDFVFSTYLGGPYASGELSDRLDEDRWTECADIADRLQLEGAFHIGGTHTQEEARSIIESWAETWPMFRLWWTSEGTVAISYLGLDHPGYRDETSWSVVRRAQEVENPKLPMDVSDSAGTISVEHLYGAASERYFGRFSVYNPDSTEDTTKPLSFPCSAARAQ